MHNGSWVSFCVGQWVMGHCLWPTVYSAQETTQFRDDVVNVVVSVVVIDHRPVQRDGTLSIRPSSFSVISVHRHACQSIKLCSENATFYRRQSVVYRQWHPVRTAGRIAAGPSWRHKRSWYQYCKEEGWLSGQPLVRQPKHRHYICLKFVVW